ncbi:MAG: hypothetical protein ACT4P7_04675 [Gemmatimonadaceae bacterium]
MLFRQAFLDGIRAGTISLAFRCWKRPTVRAGGSILTPLGQLAIGAVDAIDASTITAAQARRAGFDSLADLLDELKGRSGQVYRIELGPLRPDPRVALRASIPTNASADALIAKLQRLDTRASKPWTRQVLELIRDHPGVRAGDLADRFHMARLPFKVNVRKLKTLGLTISLEIGYRLSPRGISLLEQLTRQVHDAAR